MSDNFKTGVFWELYKDLERQFENFLEYVPYLEGNENVYSFKLLNLILSIGGHVDSVFKEMARYAKFATNKHCKEILEKLRKSEQRVRKGKSPITIPVSLPLKAFEKEYEISTRKVIFKRLPEREDIIPFEPHNPETKAPKWWKIYNGLKHDVGINMKEANLQNTLHALAGAFLLNVIHIPACIRLIEDRVVKAEITGHVTYHLLEPGWRDSIKDWIKKKKEFGIVETPIFKYNYAEKE
jgi:hypothetical protein